MLVVLADDPFLHPDGALEGMARTIGEFAAFDPSRLLPPVSPSNILCAGLNYVDPIRETNSTTPESPVIFMKPSTALIASGEHVIYPSISRHVEYEGELSVVVGRTARRVSRDQALRYVAGLCCANDVSARDYQPPPDSGPSARTLIPSCRSAPGSRPACIPDRLGPRRG